MVGQMIFHRKVLTRLCEVAMGIAYRVEHARLNRAVVQKFLRSDMYAVRALLMAFLLLSALCGQPPELADQQVLQRTAELLRDEAVWNRADDRGCPDGAPKLSLYCALRRATEEVIGISSHRTAAMEEIRSVIQEKAGEKRYPHRLMGYNNDPSTTLADIHDVISTAAEEIARRTRAIEVRSFARTVALEEEEVTSANVCAGDLDGDRDLDLVLAKGRHWPLNNSVLLNNGSGKVVSATNLAENADRTYTTALADLDGDGAPQISNPHKLLILKR